MQPEPLPPSLRELEGLLARRPTPEADGGLRDRILSGIAATRSQTAAAQPRPVRGESPQRDRRQRLVWRSAAVVVLGWNLFASAENATRLDALSLTAPSTPQSAISVNVENVENSDGLPHFAATAVAHLKPAPDAGLACRFFFANQFDAETPRAAL